MPNCDFYGLTADLYQVLDFVFKQPGWLLIELGSKPDQSLREFHATDEVINAYPAFDALTDALHFQIYAPSMGGKLLRQKVVFKPGAVPGATFGYQSRGWGLIQLYFGRLRNGRLSPCHTNHNSQRRAEGWESSYPDLGPVRAWDWAEVTRLSGRLNRFIRRTALGTALRRPVLPAAWEIHDRGLVELAPN